MSKKAPSKAKEIVDYLEERIRTGQFPGGTQIPSLRDIAERFTASFGSSRKAVNHLFKTGLVEKRHGSGVYVKSRIGGGADTGRKVALLLQADWAGASAGHGIFSTVLLGIQKAAESSGVTLLLQFGALAANAERANETLGQAAGAILLGADEYGDTYKKLSLSIPLVAVCAHDTNAGRMSIVDIDPFRAAELAVAYFKSKNIKTVVVVSSPGPAYLNRGNVFATSWRGAGGLSETLPHGSPIRFQKSKGYLFTTHSVLQHYSEIMRQKTGNILADAAAVLGIDGKNRIDPVYHKAPTIAIDWQLAGRYALEEVLYRMNNPGSAPKRIYLPGEFYAGVEG